MGKLRQQILCLVGLILALVLALGTGPSPALAEGTEVPVSGNILICFPPQYPCQIGETKGRFVGKNYIAERPLRMYMFPENNGFEGTVDVEERVVRAKGEKRPPFYTFRATQVFNGKVHINDQVYEGTVNQSLQIKGLLNPELPLDDPEQGAINLAGTWTIVGQGTGELENLKGNGTLRWTGGPVPIRYEGKIEL